MLSAPTLGPTLLLCEKSSAVEESYPSGDGRLSAITGSGVIAQWCKHRCLHRCKRRCNGTCRGAVWSRAASPVEHRAEAGDCGGGIRAGCRGARCGASGRRDTEFDLPLAPGSSGRGKWFRSGAGGAGLAMVSPHRLCRRSKSTLRVTPVSASRLRCRLHWRPLSSRRWRDDDPGSERGSSVAGGRPDRHA